MKTLLKISLCFAMCLFVSASVSATGIEDSETGTVTVQVVKSLSIDVVDADAAFIYDEHGTTTDMTAKTSYVDINASCDWMFSVNADAPTLVDGVHDPIALDVISYSVDGATATPLTLMGSPMSGGLNADFEVVWTADFTTLGNIYAGMYSVGVTYKVVEM